MGNNDAPAIAGAETTCALWLRVLRPALDSGPAVT